MRIVENLLPDDILIAESPVFLSVLFDKNGIPIISGVVFADNVVDSFVKSYESLPENAREEFGGKDDVTLQVVGYMSLNTVYNNKEKKVVGSMFEKPFMLLRDVPKISLTGLEDEDLRKMYLANIEQEVYGDGKHACEE